MTKLQIMRLLLTFLLLPVYCVSYKIVLLAADVANSQVLFNYRVASTLASAGHDVTVVFIASYDDADVHKLKNHKNVRTHVVNASVGFTKDELDQNWATSMYEDLPEGDPKTIQLFKEFLKVLTDTCRNTIRNKEFLKWLENEKFDLAFANSYHMCSVGLIHQAKIPTWIWLDSGLLKETVAKLIGVPIIPSFVSPVAMNLHDEMTYFERVRSISGHIFMHNGWQKMILSVENEHFRNEISPDFPNLADLAKKCPLVMVNDNDLYGLPKPTLGKVINIGGLGAKLKDTKPLPREFDDIMKIGNGVVLMSFGSVARLHMAPKSWKTAILEAFERLPNYQIIVRYEGNDLDDRLPPNVHFFSWLPQSDLLQHENTKAFITHGGYNSMQETIAAGVPTVMIGLFGDQMKNSLVAKKHGFAEILSKGNFTSDAIYDALDKVLHDPKYSQNANRLSKMVHKQPISPEMLVVKWTEFVAEFQHLENMEPASQKLNFLQYHSLDIILPIVFVILCGFGILGYLALRLWKYASGTTEKKKIA